MLMVRIVCKYKKLVVEWYTVFTYTISYSIYDNIIWFTSVSTIKIMHDMKISGKIPRGVKNLPEHSG